VAGLFDAEGCITIGRDGYKGTVYHRLQVSIANCDRGLLDTMVADYGGFICSVKRYSDNHTAGWQWYVTGPTAHRFLRQIGPMLIVKAAQAAVADEFMRDHQRLPDNPADDHPELLRREACYERMRRLNRKGGEPITDATLTRGKFTRQLETAAYTAGYIDGDGSIVIGRTMKKRRSGAEFPKHELMLLIATTCPYLPEWLRSTHGGTVRSTPGREAWKPRHDWKVTGERAAEVLRLVERFLRIKEAQCQIALRYQDGLVRLTRGSSKKAFNAEMRRRERAYTQMRALNQRGNTAATTKSTAPEAQPGEAIV
jgi:hypothetical protein